MVPSATLDVAASKHPTPRGWYDLLDFPAAFQRPSSLTFSGKSSDWACSLLFITSFSSAHVPTFCRRCRLRSILHDIRDAGWLLRWLGGSTAPAALLAAAREPALALLPATGADRLHILAIDSTMHGQQGQHTQNHLLVPAIPRNAPASPIATRKKFPPPLGTLLCLPALLLTPNGLRIPYWLPFYTKQHCAIFGRKHYTQADLASAIRSTAFRWLRTAGGRRRRHRLRRPSRCVGPVHAGTGSG